MRCTDKCVVLRALFARGWLLILRDVVFSKVRERPPLESPHSHLHSTQSAAIAWPGRRQVGHCKACVIPAAGSQGRRRFPRQHWCRCGRAWQRQAPPHRAPCCALRLPVALLQAARRLRATAVRCPAPPCGEMQRCRPVHAQSLRVKLSMACHSQSNVSDCAHTS